jgi:predicted nucleic acid-binding protein
VVTYVFDASAILRYLDDEAGAERVEAIINDYLDGTCQVVVSAVNWGEVATKLAQRYNKQQFEAVFAELQVLGLEVIPVTASRAIASGLFKAQKKIPYADAFGVELTASIPNSVLVTADFDVKPAAGDIKIEFLPKK